MVLAELSAAQQPQLFQTHGSASLAFRMLSSLFSDA
jgi:hypothetical protein